MSRRGERDRGKERFWRRMVRRWRRSKLTVREFCAVHGLSEPSFYGWRRTLTEREQQAGDQQRRRSVRKKPAFVPVHVVPPMFATVDPLEVVVHRGRVVRVPAGFDAVTLRQLLAVLEEPSC